MSRFFVRSQDLCGDKAYIRGNDAHHMLNVLRMKKGDKLEAVVLGKSFAAEIADGEPECVTLQLLHELESDNEADVRIWLLAGISKGEKMDTITEKATELGVYAVIPVMMEHCVVLLDDKGAQKKQERWQRIAEAAAKQCRRSHIPQVFKPCRLADALRLLPEGCSLITLWENEKEQSFREALLKSQTADVALVLGAEGGISFEEIELLRKNGTLTASLGRRILRAETAAIVAAALAMYEIGDLGGDNEKL